MTFSSTTFEHPTIFIECHLGLQAVLGTGNRAEQVIKSSCLPIDYILSGNERQ